MKKQFPWFEVILIVVFMGIQIYAAFSDGYNFPNTWFSRDDAYYYFKVAQNISEGRGSTFDGIHPTNGYHPLWMLINIPIFALARFDLILPLRVLLIVMSALALAAAILLYRLLKEALSPPVGMLAATYWVFDFYVQIVFYRPGLESGIALFLIVLLLHQLRRYEKDTRHPKPLLRPIAWLGLIALLAAFARLDLIFFAAIVGIWIVFQKTPLRYLLPFDILAVFAAALTAFIGRLGLLNYYNSPESALIMIATGLLIKIPVFYFFGLYQRPSSWRPVAFLKNTILAVGLSSFAMSAILLGGSALRLLPVFSRAILLMDALYTLGAILLIRALAYAFRVSLATDQILTPVQLFRDQWKNWLKAGSLYYGIVGGGLSVYMLWSKIEFGTFSPVSGQVKRWWGTFRINVYGGPAQSLLSFLGLDPNGDFNAWNPLTSSIGKWIERLLYANPSEVANYLRQRDYLWALIAIAVVVCGILIIQRQRTARAIAQTGPILLFVGGWLQILSYSATGYSSPKEWYWLTEQIFLAAMAALLIDLLYKFLLKRWTFVRAAMWAVIVFYGVSSVFQYSQDVYARMPYGYTDPGKAYVEVVPFLEALTRPGDVIGMTGGGNVGYFIRGRTIVNMDGLINSYDYFQALKNGASADYLYDSGMRFVFANPSIINFAPYRGQYTDRLQPIIDWGGKDLMRLLPKPAP